MNVLVTGGAGYIGSHAVKLLLETGHHVIVIDDLSRGNQKSIPRGVPFYYGDIKDTSLVISILENEKIDCVMHFAAFAYVGESVKKPLIYYDNNTVGTISLFTAMQQVGVKKLIFSSTCATYGNPLVVPVNEETPQNPISPYGRSKYFIERILFDIAAVDPDFSFSILRYFNVAGCALDGTLGEDHRPETHLIPLVLQISLERLKRLDVFGGDYDTLDGTCVRDYIHVEDLVRAHIMVMEILKPGDTRFYNLGNGCGYSVYEIVNAVEKITKIGIDVKVKERRIGDVAALFSDSSKAKREIGWEAKIDLNGIVESAWRWFRDNPDGYLTRFRCNF